MSDNTYILHFARCSMMFLALRCTPAKNNAVFGLQYDNDPMLYKSINALKENDYE